MQSFLQQLSSKSFFGSLIKNAQQMVSKRVQPIFDHTQCHNQNLNQFQQAKSTGSTNKTIDPIEKKVHQHLLKERTFIMVKPDGVRRGLVGDIVTRFERKGFKMVAMKYCKPDRSHIENHYLEHKHRVFFPELVDFMCEGPVVPMVWEGENVVATSRKMLGATQPFDAQPGTIRGDYAITVTRNICHGSDAVETATKEINLWFSKEELVQWQQPQKHWLADEHTHYENSINN